ncbi:MAG: UPF0147 family protein [Thermoplasmata archaeon]
MSSPSLTRGSSAPAGADPDTGGLGRITASLTALGDDGSVPRNVRRAAIAAREALSRATVARDVRIAGALSVLDELANDPNLPSHGRTAIWSIMSQLESLQ